MKFPESKWNIGDWIYILQDVVHYNELAAEEKKYAKKPGKLLIVGILADVCTAGTQIGYKFRAYTKEGMVNILYNEIELTDKLE